MTRLPQLLPHRLLVSLAALGAIAGCVPPAPLDSPDDAPNLGDRYDTGDTGDSGDTEAPKSEDVDLESQIGSDAMGLIFLPLDPSLFQGLGQGIQGPPGLLATRYEQLNQRFPLAEVWMGIRPGQGEPERTLFIDPEFARALLPIDAPLDPLGNYLLEQFGVATETCAISGISVFPDFGEPDPADIQFETALNGKPGGICATLSVAHSLVKNLEMVDPAWAGILAGANWDPAFLRRINNIGREGNTDARSMNWSQIHRAHTAAYSSRYDLDESTSGVQGHTPGTDSAGALQSWCEELVSRSSEDDDDCILTLFGGNGHGMTVRSASWVGGRCVIYTENTGIQDGAANDYAGIPYNPGVQEWAVTETGITNLRGSNTGFWNGLGFTTAQYRCYDEDVMWTGTSANGKGTALY